MKSQATPISILSPPTENLHGTWSISFLELRSSTHGSPLEQMVLDLLRETETTHSCESAEGQRPYWPRTPLNSCNQDLFFKFRTKSFSSRPEQGSQSTRDPLRKSCIQELGSMSCPMTYLRHFTADPENTFCTSPRRQSQDAALFSAKSGKPNFSFSQNRFVFDMHERGGEY